MLIISISEKTAMWMINVYPLIATWEVGVEEPNYSIMWDERDLIHFPYERIEQW